MSNRQHWDKLYHRQIWKHPVWGIRAAKLRRDPYCEVLGCDQPATTVDHRVAHKGNWFLFIGGIDFENLRSCCAAHHNAKRLADEKAGAHEFNPVSATGDRGRQFQSATVTAEQINAALPQTQAEIDDLLSGIPE